jgi:O-antigen ligase
MVTLLPIIGIRFLRSGWKGKLLCLVAAGLVCNTVVLTQSRGGFLAAGVGLVAALTLAPKGGRKQVWPLVILGTLGALTLVNDAYIERMWTINADEEETDGSVQSRQEIWGGGLRMAMNNPLGVGPGNFHARIGEFLPGHEGRDAHNSYIRCVGELGWPGLVLFFALIINAFATLTRIRCTAASWQGLEDYVWIGFALQISLLSYLVSSAFSTTLYIEMMWWILLLPAALERVTANAVKTALAGRDDPPGD